MLIGYRPVVSNSPVTADPPASGRRIRGLDASQRREQRRSQLLDAALQLFADQGYHNTSIEQICQVAYVGTKGFYETFDSKEACYIDLLRQITAQVGAALEQVLRAAPADERQANAIIIADFAHALVDDPRVAKVTFGEASGVSRAIERQRRENRRWAALFVESIWDRYDPPKPAKGTGSRPAADRHQVAIGVVGGLFDLLADWLIDADPAAGADTDRLIAGLTAFYQAVRDGSRPN